MIYEEYKKPHPTAIKIAAACSSAVNCFEGIDQVCSAERWSKLHLKKVGKRDENQYFVLPGPPLAGRRPRAITAEVAVPSVCCIIHTFAPSLGSDSFLWRREQKKALAFFWPKKAGIYLQQCKELSLISRFLRFTCLYHLLALVPQRESKGRKMLVLT